MNKGHPMKHRTNRILRDIFFPGWDEDMEEFFSYALADLRRYSDEIQFPQWAHPPPEISESGHTLQVDFLIPGIESDSLEVDIVEDVVILSGRRWCKPPQSRNPKRVDFRRVIRTPAPVRERGKRVSCGKDGQLRLTLEKRPARARSA